MEERDTDTVQYGLGTAARRCTAGVGAVGAMAGWKIREDVAKIAAHLLEVSVRPSVAVDDRGNIMDQAGGVMGVAGRSECGTGRGCDVIGVGLGGVVGEGVGE